MSMSREVMICEYSMYKSTKRGPFFTLNSGLFVGDAVSLRQFFEKMSIVQATADKDLSVSIYNDQILFQLTYLRYPELNVFVDTDASMFFVFNYLFQIQ